MCFSTIKPDVVYKRIVMPSDLNPAGYLFGGSMMKWIDEAGAIYGCELLGLDKHFVTLKVSEVLFKHPAPLGALLTFYASLSHTGKTSFSVSVSVHSIDPVRNGMPKPAEEIVKCDITFVSIDKDGKPTPHNI